MLAKYNTGAAEAGKLLDVDAVTWSRVCKGAYWPTKNLLFSLAITSHISLEDTCDLLAVCGFELDYALVKDSGDLLSLIQEHFQRGNGQGGFGRI